MQTITHAMIFAAGFGTRMGELTKDRPKPLIKVAGRTLLDHAVELAQDAGLNAVVNAHYHADQIHDHLKGRGNLTVLTEWPDVLETGGGLKNALNALGSGPVFTMNSDAVWRGETPFSVLQNHWNPAVMDALLLVIPAARAVGHQGHGDFKLAADGQLVRGGNMVYTGLQITKTEGLKSIDQPAFSLNLLWVQMAKSNRLFGVEYKGDWADVGRPECIALAEDMLANV